MKSYTITYHPQFGGFNYYIRSAGEIVGQGWTLGAKKNAEEDARGDVAKLMAKPSQKAAA